MAQLPYERFNLQLSICCPIVLRQVLTLELPYVERIYFLKLASRVPTTALVPDLGMSLDSKSDDKELKEVTPEKSKTCVTAFTKKLVATFQLSRTRCGHISLK